MVSSTPVLDIEEDFYAGGCHVHDAYKRYFLENKVKGGEGHYQVHLHSNGLCYLTLAPTHPIIRDNYVIKSVVFSDKTLNNVVSGKRKRGCQSLQSTSPLCTVHTECGKTFEIRASVDGKLAEVNKRLVQNPQEIKSPLRGYFAIFMTKWVDVDTTPVPTGWIPEQDFVKE